MGCSPYTSSLFMDLMLSNFALGLFPILYGVAIPAASLLVEIIRPNGELRRLIGLCGDFGRVCLIGSSGIKNPIREQFDTVIHEEPNQRVAPNEHRPAPAE